jgi:hypothetical protein
MKSLIKGYVREKWLGTAVLDNQLKDGGEVVRPYMPSTSPLEDSCFSFLLETEKITGQQCGWKA